MHFVDSHTEGEPTRVIVSGGPDLGEGPLVERRQRFKSEFDAERRFAVNEPRGHDAIVGALLTPPVDLGCAAGVIYFNNTGTIGMCGHGTIGLAVTLHHLGRIHLGLHRFETPVGIVSARLTDANTVTITNVPSYVFRLDVTVDVPGLGPVKGDIAWGGNWFFLCDRAPVALQMTNISKLSSAAEAVSLALLDQGIVGSDGARVDHIEFFGPPVAPEAQSRNFVYCPGGAYDRSPCGTGTSAKLACLAARGKLAPGATWTQESIVGSHFTARYTLLDGGKVLPEITGRAYITAEGQLVRQRGDPFAAGIVQQARSHSV